MSNGRDVVISDAEGLFRLPAAPARRGDGFVSVTCPADADCPVWFHRLPGGRAEGSLDFALLPAAVEDEFFFVHLSDAHVYPSVEEMARLLPDGGLPWYVPRVVAGWVLLRAMGRMYPHHDRETIVAALREIVSRHHDVSDAWDTTVMMDYVDLALDPATGLIDPARDVPPALAEIAGLRPSFAVNTGDMVLEGNNGDADAIERWYAWYDELVGRHDLEIHETIGNNELAGTHNDEFPPSDPRYGKALFRKRFGPTRYSFEHGPFHFAAVDTHKALFDPADPDPDEDWTFYEMEGEVRDWLDADLARASAAGRRLVVLNHEPFFYDPVWQFDDPTPADDEGLLERYGVAYELPGHIHRNGFRDAPPEGGVTHITTGALSGFRWALPLSIDRRGYRVLYARDGKLWSAWKDTGQPLLAFVDPRGEADAHPASTHARAPGALGAGPLDVVAVGVDVDRPFARLSLWLDGAPLETRRWGDYFVHARIDAARLGASGILELRAESVDGRAQQARLAVARGPVAGAVPGGGR